MARSARCLGPGVLPPIPSNHPFLEGKDSKKNRRFWALKFQIPIVLIQSLCLMTIYCIDTIPELFLLVQSTWWSTLFEDKMCPKDIHILDLLELCAQLPPRRKVVGMKLGQGSLTWLHRRLKNWIKLAQSPSATQGFGRSFGAPLSRYV